MRSERIDEYIKPRRFSIVGATGSGKTYLARSLAEKLRLPLVELDACRWDSLGRELPREEFIEAVRDLAAGEQWIIDGHYRDVRHLVWDRAEIVIWLNYPSPLIAARLLRRFARKRLSRKPGARKVISRAEPFREHARAKWGDRIRRFVRTMKERGEYRWLLHASEYGHLHIVELKSVRATNAWLCEISR